MRDIFYRMETPQEQENETVLSATEISYTPHLLENKWTLWYYENDKSRNWLENLHEVYTCDTVEQFWSLFNHIKSVDKITMGNDYSLFKTGIKPMWEDERNKNGGRWLINFEGKMKEHLPEKWLDLLLYMIGESFDQYSNDICGAFVNIRRVDKISLWIASNNESDIMEIGKKLKECLNLPNAKITYEMHADSQSKGSSRAKTLFVL